MTIGFITLILLTCVLCKLIIMFTQYTYGISIEESLLKYGCPTIELTQEGALINFLIDTGANINYIDKKALSNLRAKGIDNTYNSFNSLTTEGRGKTYGACNISFWFKDKEFNADFVIIDINNSEDSYSFSGVLGSDFFVNNNSVIDFKKLIFYVK